MEVRGGLRAIKGVRTDRHFGPVLDEEGAADLEPPPPPPKDAGRGYTVLGSSGYADDTQAVALGAVSLQGTVPTTH